MGAASSHLYLRVRLLRTIAIVAWTLLLIIVLLASAAILVAATDAGSIAEDQLVGQFRWNPSDPDSA